MRAALHRRMGPPGGPAHGGVPPAHAAGNHGECQGDAPAAEPSRNAAARLPPLEMNRADARKITRLRLIAQPIPEPLRVLMTRVRPALAWNERRGEHGGSSE